jgi:hypothetical protein
VISIKGRLKVGKKNESKEGRKDGFDGRFRGFKLG